MAEWEILDSLYRSFSSYPDETEFANVLQFLVNQNYARILRVGETRRVQLGRDGLNLLRELQKEYEAIVAGR